MNTQPTDVQFAVHHRNGDPTDNSIENLQLLRAHDNPYVPYEPNLLDFAIAIVITFILLGLASGMVYLLYLTGG
jgi:hypothetical protein